MKSYPNQTNDRRMRDIEKLNGKQNGWWVYQYCKGILNERKMIHKRERRQHEFSRSSS